MALKGRLLLVPCPLDFGSGESVPDIQRVLPHGALEAAAGLQHWVVENARTARAVLKRVGAVVPLAAPLQQLHIVELPRPPKGRSAQQAPDLRPLLQPALQGHDIGLMSEAGMPAVADPGAALVAAAHGLGIPVRPLPGPSALLLALAASGLNGQRFAFNGYLPVDGAERATRIRELEALSRRAAQAQLLIETPYRNEAMLSALLATLQPTTQLSVSCGLTLETEWTRSDAVARWRAQPRTLPSDVPAVFVFQA
ncbi:SAM-dependent methyltransferase [Azohydromonas caseinilytica]|uniref:SAM-dependent methyltransferase n=1 Tax=Azohydromonas caseinilytica TaxID=2728836 RepID=A0A848F4U2_9BURK|nr:SAM-dependent methyltransferase [Azohydromonas caseinilytica]NML15067.1 SAM-dependent methyltransferase [Azohydromonas caseinilytica]